jgi:thiol-disulfide isomerase/thioredoxin
MRTAKRPILFLIILLFFLTDFAKASSAKPGSSMGERLSELSREMKKIDLYLFHSEECGSCQRIIPGLTERLETMYPSLKVTLLDLKEPKNYEALRNFERRFGQRGEELPFAVIGNHLLSGEKEIMERLDPIILEYLLKEPPKPIPESSLEQVLAISKDYENPFQGEVSAELIYFNQSGCAKCGRTDVLLDHLKRKYPKLSIKKVDLSTPEGKRMGEAISERMNLPNRERLTAPSILIGEKFLSAKEISDERIEEVLLGLKRNLSPIVIQPGEMMKAEKSIIERFKSLGPIPVAFGGLIDGINPCAFATLIFLVSYLTLTGRKREEIFKVGLGFTGAVFLTYLLIGLVSSPSSSTSLSLRPFQEESTFWLQSLLS